MPDSPDAPASLPAATKPKISPWTIWVPVIIMVLGIMITYNWLVYVSFQEKKHQLPKLARLESDNLVLTERSGKQVHLADLRGKVLLAAYLYVDCPMGCSTVASLMDELNGEFGKDSGVHFISFAFDPKDTPEKMKAFALDHGFKAENWWFLSGDQEQIKKYLVNQFKFHAVQEKPVAQRGSAADQYIHDMRVALVDHLGNVRGFYDIASPYEDQRSFWHERIRVDIKTLLAERAADK
jgi:cytochrome oxidase Cu insertion factor (SCO1/SenC/PrrC family)